MTEPVPTDGCPGGADTETWPDVRDVRHIELELPAAIEGHRQASCDYAAGDVAVVYARNRPVTTQRFLRLLRLDGDARVDALRVKAMGRGETGVEAAREFLVHQLNIQPPCALRELVSAQPDLERPPRPSMLRALAALASDPDHGLCPRLCDRLSVCLRTSVCLCLRVCTEGRCAHFCHV